MPVPKTLNNDYIRLKLTFLFCLNRLFRSKKMNSPSGMEELRQRIHELERELSLTKSLKDVMQCDIETLQAQLSRNDESFMEYKGKIATELSSKRTEEINLLRNELDEQKETSEKIIADLMQKINELENKSSVIIPSKDDDEFLRSKLIKLEEENESLSFEINEIKLLLQDKEDEKTYLNTKLKNLEEKYEETNEMLDSTKEALNQTSEALRELQEEKALLSSELAMLKAGPVDEQRRGNSLFAEVEDSRQHLKKNNATLKAKLNEFKVILSAKQSENDLLMNENDRLRQKIREMDSCFIKPEQLQQLLEARQQRIKELELLVTAAPKQDLPNTNANEYQKLKWAMDTLEKTRNSNRDLQHEFNKLSHQRLLDNEELSSLRLAVLSLKDQISNLKMDYEIKLQKLRENNCSENMPKENLNPNVMKKVNDESIKTCKTVRFAEQ
ncbi:hypothetical protein O3M35_011794 [Rhynocoris fuscipes]|uniref:Uncharacterized protein n=1 Tax=Rhynocoris fuscipes TaxID=488301 RepID=A0AAW1CXX4_9HEMI